jgi:hypothetical protein
LLAARCGGLFNKTTGSDVPSESFAGVKIRRPIRILVEVAAVAARTLSIVKINAIENETHEFE